MHSERTRGPRSAFLLASALALACSFILVRDVRAQGASIGLYSDASGTTCSFSGDAVGLVTAYVVIRPDINGISGVQFAAPVPACFGATYVSEVLAPGVLAIGNSQTGISLALPGCAGQPYSALQINYYRSGGTSLCCEYPIVAEPSQSGIVASDCAFADVPITTVSSRFNADASCECVGNSAPLPPSLPQPPDHATDAGVRTQLTWFASDDDDNIAGYDVYFGPAPSPSLVATVAEASYLLPVLDPLTQYYWRVVVRDAFGVETGGPEWTFTTRVLNLPPYPPTDPVPANEALNVKDYTTLRWVGADIDLDSLTFDVYFGQASPPPLLVANLTAPIHNVGGLEFTTRYYWRVVARDPFGEEATSAIWSFVTKPENYPPDQPSNPFPASGATLVWPTQRLSWNAWDVEDYDTLTYDVYLGPSPTPALFESGVPTNSYTPAGLSYATQYYWRIVVHDRDGAETSGPVWTYTTRDENYPPNPPSTPSPPNGSTNRPLNQTLAWAATDPDGQGPLLVFDVYFGTASPPPLAATNLATKAFAPGPLSPLTTYRWRIVARDPFGSETTGPTWSFTTRANSPPNAPSSPSPGNNQHANASPVLTWNATDPDGQTLTYEMHFGTASPPPWVATGLTERRFEPGSLQPGTRYYWRVVASDGQLSTQGPIWSFTAHAAGDADLDGEVTLDDASCALGAFVGWGPCYGLNWLSIADVDCNGRMTPRDARCIHLHVFDGSCAFCNEAAAPRESIDAPNVWVSSTWEWNDTLYVRLAASGIPSLEAAGFFVATDNVEFVGAKRRGASSDFAALEWTPSPNFSWVGGYSLTGSSVGQGVEFMDLLFVGPAYGFVQIVDFVDDLAGASPVTFNVGGGSVPVLITRFTATRVDAGVDVRWELRSDEALESFTLYRREGGDATSIVLSQGPATARSFLDTSIEGGKTYDYELLIRTVDGDEFRSQVATVSTRASTLTLHQNHPNPFNPQTTISYQLPPSARSQRVRLWILDISGRVVRTLIDENQAGGSYRVEWSGTDDGGDGVSSGVYFYVLDVAGERRTRKLVLLK